jgi:hypothetical protein
LLLYVTMFVVSVFAMWVRSTYHGLPPPYAKWVGWTVLIVGLGGSVLLARGCRCPRCNNRFRSVNIFPPFEAHACPKCGLDFTQAYQGLGVAREGGQR